jgi:hypothetical protein
MNFARNVLAPLATNLGPAGAEESGALSRYATRGLMGKGKG